MIDSACVRVLSRMLSEQDAQELLEQFPIVDSAFAYGSGAVKQSGYEYTLEEDELPMMDLVFAVEDPVTWHEENMKRNPGTFPLCIGHLCGAVPCLESNKVQHFLFSYRPLHDSCAYECCNHRVQSRWYKVILSSI